MFIQIKTYASLERLSSRHEADQEMRDRFRDFVGGAVALDKLIGVSAFGPQVAVYEYIKATGYLIPPLIPAHPELITDTAPKARWAYNLLQPNGGAKFREVVNSIKALVATLNRGESRA